MDDENEVDNQTDDPQSSEKSEWEADEDVHAIYENSKTNIDACFRQPMLNHDVDFATIVSTTILNSRSPILSPLDIYFLFYVLTQFSFYIFIILLTQNFSRVFVTAMAHDLPGCILRMFCGRPSAQDLN